MEVRVSPHRHSQSLSRDVPSTLRLPSAIIHRVDKDDEKSTKNTKMIGEEENVIFCRRLRRLRLASSRSPRLFGASSQKSFFSSAQKEGGETLCERRRCDRFFLPRKRREKRV